MGHRYKRHRVVLWVGPEARSPARDWVVCIWSGIEAQCKETWSPAREVDRLQLSHDSNSSAGEQRLREHPPAMLSRW